MIENANNHERSLSRAQFMLLEKQRIQLVKLMRFVSKMVQLNRIEAKS